jgi:hypothetical protein
MPGQPLKILLLHERFPPDYGGGGEYVVHQIARHLIGRGHQVRVVTTGDPTQDSFDGVPLHRRTGFAAPAIHSTWRRRRSRRSRPRGAAT